MDISKGVVSKLRNTVELSSGSHNNGITTTYVAIFKIDKQPVQLKSSEAILIDENDNVAVAGKVNNGIFNAYAYKNNTTGVSGNIGMRLHLFFGVVFPLAGAYAINVFSTPLSSPMPKLIGAIFIGSGLYTLYKGIQISKASKLLQLK